MRSNQLALLLITAAAEHHCPARTPGDDVANVHINGAAVGCYTGPCERCLVGAECATAPNLTMTYSSVTAAAGGAFSPWKMMIEVTADEMHDHLGLATMIAPSPDWFTGASSLELCDYETGMWKEEVTHMAMAYDAGTDAGMTFTADDMPEDSAKPISMIMCGDADAFCDSGDMMPVATITVTKMMM